MENKRSKHAITSLLLLMCLLCAVRSAEAQASKGEDPAQVQRCAIAIEIVRTGDSRAYSRATVGYPDQYKQRWAYSHIRTCGASGVAALAMRINATRNSPDVSQLDLFTSPTRSLLDGNLFQLAMRLANDPGASDEARVFAIRTLMWAIEPRLDLRYDGLAAGPGAGRCVKGASLHIDTFDVAPLPGNRRTQLEDLTRSILNARTSSVQLRNAAGCAAAELRLTSTRR